MRSNGRRVAAVLAAVAAVGLLAGCSSGSGPRGPVQEYSGGPEEIDEEFLLPGEPQAFYVSDGAGIAVVLWGSSSCPPVADRMVVDAPKREGNTVSVTVREDFDGPCTLDLAPHTSVFVTPTDIATFEPLTILVGNAEIVILDSVLEPE